MQPLSTGPFNGVKSTTSATQIVVENQLKAENPVLLKDVQRQYREAIWPWFGKSWFMQRALDKPRGYPGDYQMLTAIYNDVPKAKGLGGYLDRFWLNLTLAKAVFGRMLSLRKFLNEEFATRHGKIAVLDVACGACREFTEDFSIPSENVVALTCVDNDNHSTTAQHHLIQAEVLKVTTVGEIDVRRIVRCKSQSLFGHAADCESRRSSFRLNVMRVDPKSSSARRA